MFGPLLEVEMSKKCTPLWREAHFEVKMYKAHHVRTTFGCWDVEKVHAVVERSTFRSQHVKNTRVRTTFGRSDVLWRGRCKGVLKVSKTWGFCSMSKNDGRRGTFEEDLQRCIFRGRRSTRDMFMRDVRRSGRWFPEKGCILEHQIFRFAEMILRPNGSYQAINAWDPSPIKDHVPMNVLTATGYVWAIFSWPMIYTCVIVLQHWLQEAIANMASLFTSCRWWWPSQGIASELHESPENLTRWPFGDSHYDIIWPHGSSKLGRTSSWNNQPGNILLRISLPPKINDTYALLKVAYMGFM